MVVFVWTGATTATATGASQEEVARAGWQQETAPRVATSVGGACCSVAVTLAVVTLLLVVMLLVVVVVVV